MPPITPEKVVLAALPAVSAPLPRFTLPAPASAPMVLAKLFRSSTPPLATVKAEPATSTLAAPARQVPPEMVVAPL